MLPDCKGRFAVADASRRELLLALCQQSYLLIRRMANRAPPDTEKAMAADRVETPGRVYLEWKHKWEKMMWFKLRETAGGSERKDTDVVSFKAKFFRCMSVQDTHMHWCRDSCSSVRFKLLAHITVELCHLSWFYSLRFALRSSPR